MPLDEKGRVCIDPGETVTFHIRGWKRDRVNVAPRGATQRIFKNALVLELDEVDGESGEFEYRVTSERLAGNMMPLLESGAYQDRTVVLRAEGTGFSRFLEYHTGPRGVEASPTPSPGPLPTWAVEYVGGGVYRGQDGQLRDRRGRFAKAPGE